MPGSAEQGPPEALAATVLGGAGPWLLWGVKSLATHLLASLWPCEGSLQDWAWGRGSLGHWVPTDALSSAESGGRSSLSVLIPIAAAVVTCLVGICIYCLVHTGKGGAIPWPEWHRGEEPAKAGQWLLWLKQGSNSRGTAGCDSWSLLPSWVSGLCPWKQLCLHHCSPGWASSWRKVPVSCRSSQASPLCLAVDTT